MELGCLFLFSVLFVSAVGRPYLHFLTNDDFVDNLFADDDFTSDWEDFPDSDFKSEIDVDPGSWTYISNSDLLPSNSSKPSSSELLYGSGVRRMLEAVAIGDPRAMEDATSEIETAALSGYPHAQSTLAFLHNTGTTRDLNAAKAFLYHYFAADNGNMQSKMALAYSYHRREMYEKSVKLYAELAKAAIECFLFTKDSPLIEPVRIHKGAEENKELLRKFRGEEDEDFQIMEYQAEKGNAAAMLRLAVNYYYGLRGLRQDQVKALSYFLKAAEKGDQRAMELLGEIYARGAGVARNYSKALEWLILAIKHEHFSAYNGLGYLYAKGYGVEKNYTKARECFERAIESKEPAGYYNLGILYLKGFGVRKDMKTARKYIITAAIASQPKAFYHLAKMFQTGIGLRENLATASNLYKVVAERGPWSSLSSWALESYMKGDVRTAFFLYSRMGELGYEVAQSNAAWILDKYGGSTICMGASGFCTDSERHQRALCLWWQASEQGNEHAALLIGDAYYYGRGTERDYERAVEAYMHAHSQSNAQAMFNLGYMHEHGQGVPLDLHLAKRYYDEALENDPAAKLPVSLALGSLYLRKNYPNSYLVHLIDSLPEVNPILEAWIEKVIMDEGNVTILTLVICLFTVLYLRERQRQQAEAPHL